MCEPQRAPDGAVRPHRLDPLPNALILVAAAYVFFVFRAYNDPDI